MKAHAVAPWRWVGWIVVAFLAWMALLLQGCTSRPVIAPSTIAVRGQVAQAKLEVRTVRGQLAQAQVRLKAAAVQVEKIRAEVPEATRPAVVELSEQVTATQTLLTEAEIRAAKAEQQLDASETAAATLQVLIDDQAKAHASALEQAAKFRASAITQERLAWKWRLIALGIIGVLVVFHAGRFYLARAGL